MFRCIFDTGNADFDERREHAVADILKVVTREVLEGATKGTMYDINGNPVGKWSLTYPKHIKKGA